MSVCGIPPSRFLGVFMMSTMCFCMHMRDIGYVLKCWVNIVDLLTSLKINSSFFSSWLQLRVKRVPTTLRMFSTTAKSVSSLFTEKTDTNVSMLVCCRTYLHSVFLFVNVYLFIWPVSPQLSKYYPYGAVFSTWHHLLYLSNVCFPLNFMQVHWKMRNLRIKPNLHLHWCKYPWFMLHTTFY